MTKLSAKLINTDWLTRCVVQVGDLEGTLVGNQESMMAFKSYWDIMAVSKRPIGLVL
jgi:hypothetical protein